MSEAQMESRQVELKSRRICRFCMSQTEPLSNIYSRENRLNSSAPLPLQVMACVSIEVFTNDGMPNTICDYCRMLMEHCYRFKQMCKKADTALRQYPLTGTWPNALDLPKIPDELIQKQIPNLKVKQPSPKKPTTTTTTTSTSVAVEKRSPIEVTKSPAIYSNVRPPKLLNKNSIKILNKDAQVSNEPILSKPKIKRDIAGNVEIVTEILDQNEFFEEPDPIKTAVQVETNVFPCPHCERSFPLRQLLDIHMVNHNRKRSFECTVCEKRFFSKYDLGKHMLIHTGEKPYECVVCKRAFTRSTLLHRHEKIHTDQPKFLCVYCEKPFLSKDELEKHTERHQKNRPFPCKICGKCFAFKQGLERHETVHAKNQPFPCQYCDQSFSTPSKLSRHLTAHAGDRPFPCKLCPKSYLLSHHLTRHLRSHTQGSGSYKCYDCEKTFTTRDDLIYHSAVHATQNLVCPLCKEQFEDLDLVTDHVKQHAEGEQYACEFCDLIFMTAEKLQNHSAAEHSEDLAAYEEHTKNNIIDIKREMNLQYDSSQDDQNEEGEVIQEFIIEEYHQDEPMVEERPSRNVKQENEITIEKTKRTGPTRIFSSVTEVSSASLKSQENELGQVEEEVEYDDMEIETLEREDDEEMHFEVEEDIEEEIEPPPPKLMRPARKSEGNTKYTYGAKVLNIVTKEETKKQFSNRKIPILKPESTKLKQPTINTVLQQLPKTVTIVKKEKAPIQKPKDESPRETRSSTNEKKPEIRILNERVTKKPISKENINKVVSQKVSTLPRQKPQNEKSVENNAKIRNSELSVKSTTPKQIEIAKKIEPKQQLSNQSTSKKLAELIGDHKVKVQQIIMTKAEVAAMTKEGKIEMKGGTMILKQDRKSFPGKVITKK